MANFPLTDTLIGFTRTLFLYLSRVAFLEQINVLRHEVFVVLKSHKISLFLSDLFNCTDVRFLFQYGVGLELRGCYSNVRLGRFRSARLITKSVYTGVSERVTHLHIGVPVRNFHEFKKEKFQTKSEN